MTTGTQPSAPPERSRARTLVPLGIAAWLLVEIWLLMMVASAAGGFTVLALLVGGVVLGAYVIKRAGRRAFRNLTETLQQQQSGTAAPGAGPQPGSEGNTLTMLGGLLLIVPGLMSDVLGLLCLVPPVRKVATRFVERSLEKRMRAARPGSLGDAFQQARMRQPDGKVVQGEVIRDDGRASSPYGEDGGPRPPLTP
ncbi:FxsA family membrane protein [Streptomyces sp. NPDC023838]|uniref:FxsA family membrane protein n=1 Tax=unclassified Streptomyces TaxID=2593676 RepID=UPI0033E82395